MENTTSLLSNYSPYEKEIDISNTGTKGSISFVRLGYIEKFNCANNQITDLYNLPKSLKYLDCSNNLITKLDLELQDDFEHLNYSNNPLESLFWNINKDIKFYPETLKNLTFGKNYNLQINGLPDFIENLSFDKSSLFDKPLDNLHSTNNSNYVCGLKYLYLGDMYNQPINNLPNTIEYLQLGKNFNNPIDNLPESLISLSFSKNSNFNCPVDNLPNNLTFLQFEDEFNCKIDNLPNKLSVLYIGHNFNQPIDNLPDSIIDLKLGYSFNQPINRLPKSLLNLIFGNDYGCSKFKNNISNYPGNLLVIKIPFSKNFSNIINNLPDSVKKITLDFSNDYDLLFEHVENFDYNSKFESSEIITKIPKKLEDFELKSNDLSESISNLSLRNINIKIEDFKNELFNYE